MLGRVKIMSKGMVNKKERKYIPGLALFNFEPAYNWSKKEALDLFNSQIDAIDLGSYDLDEIYYQDCLKGMQELPPESIDVIIADPPFGIEFSGKEHLYNRKEENVVDDYCEISLEDYDAFSRAWIRELPRIMKDTSTAFIFSGWTNLESVLYAIRIAGLHVINHIIWQYQFGVFTKRKFVTSHYHLLFLAKNADSYFFHKIKHYPKDVWHIKREYKPQEEKNGTKLPLKLIEDCIDYSSKPGDIILDPFMGNGTTAEAAKANYRHFIGFEINKNLQNINQRNLKAITLGEHYVPYNERFKKWLDKHLEILSRKYPKAYKIWFKMQQE